MTTERLNEFFADCTDFELCNVLSLGIEKKYGFDSLRHHQKHIPHERWVIHTVWSSTGFLECEGYATLWPADMDQLGFADAMEEIGFEILASIVRDSIALVPAKLLGNWDAIEAHTASEDARDEAAELMDEKLISDHPDINGKLARYARDRRETFLDLLDDLFKIRTEKRKMAGN